MEASAINEADLRSVLEPEFNHNTFFFGRNKDGSKRTWKLLPLPWKYEKNFRKQVMPFLAITYKPFEVLVQYFSQDFVSDLSPSFTKAIFDAEISVDDYLVRAVVSILIYQDPEINEKWVEDNADSRDQLLSIVITQCEIHKIMDRVGELLVERLGKLLQMMGIDLDLDTLKQLWKQASAKLSAKIMNLCSIAANVSGHSMDSSSETGLLPSKETNENNSDKATTSLLNGKTELHNI